MRTRQVKKAASSVLLEALRQSPNDMELFKQYLIRLEQEREASGMNALMDKFTAARAQGLDLNEADRTRLLALLLENRLKGTMSE